MKTLLLLVAVLTGVHSTCPLGYAKNFTYDGEETCKECGPLGKYCPTESLMQSCPKDLLVTATGQCGCGDGHYKLSDSCIQCPADSYCTYYSTSPTPCNNNLSSVAGSSACKCSRGRTSIGPPSSTSDCFCPQGTYWNLEELQCTACPVDNYCPYKTTAPIKCPYDSSTNYSISIKPTGKPYLSDCKCIGGKYLTAAGECVICPVGYYCYPASNFPFPCWLNFVNTTTSSIGATSPSDCKCVKGRYFSPQRRCELCPVGYFCDGAFNTVTTCPFFQTTSDIGSIHDYDCHLNIILIVYIVIASLAAIFGLLITLCVIHKSRRKGKRNVRNIDYDEASLGQESA